MKKIFYIIAFFLLAACSEKANPDTPGGDDPKPGPAPQTVTFVASITASQILMEPGYDTLAVASATIPADKGVEFQPVVSYLSFSLGGNKSKIDKIRCIKFETISEIPDIQPFGKAEVRLNLNSGTGNYDCGISSVFGSTYNSASLSGQFSQGDYAFVAFPGDYIGVKYVVEFNDGTSCTIQNSDFAFSTTLGSNAKLPDINVSNGSDRPESAESLGWFELPAFTDADQNGIDDNNSDYYYSNTYRADAQDIRNFSCCYSAGKVHPVWVAAPMHVCYQGNSGRNDYYTPDPKISCTQAGKWPGYTRGHMLGSSDRTISVATNRQVFYHSNIGAQLSVGFNNGDGAWNNLENVVNNQWCSDTLYQVIGCIFDTWTDKYGNTVEPVTCGDSQIPTAYYKVLLRTKSGDSGKSVDQCSASELKCCAFILAHRDNKGHDPCKDDMYSVEALEKLTGLTYFVNVPNAPKSTALASDWGL